jgi:peroxiredoxin Q/BCP
MVELRKRKTPPPAPVRPAKKKAAPKGEGSKASKVKAAVAEKVEAVKEKVSGKSNGAENAEAPNGAAATGTPVVGDTINLAGFGGEVETQDGLKTSLAKLIEESKAGIVLFTYPKASTPGCESHSSFPCISRVACVLSPLYTGTTQACLFRDSYEPLTSTGFGIYGLSTDSPKANTTFKTKQKLPYPLLCDPSGTLIKAIGLQKTPKGTKRGVFVINKSGKVLASEPGGPQATVDVVKKLVESGGTAPAATDAEQAREAEDAGIAKTASEVADTAAKLDSTPAVGTPAA